MISPRQATQDASGSRWQLQLGARPLGDGSTRFRVWAPLAESVAVKVIGGGAQTFPLGRGDEDVFEARVAGVRPGAGYFYLLDGGRERPDPVSRWQPGGA